MESQKNEPAADDPVELIAVRKVNDNFFRACLASDPSQQVMCRHRDPSLFPPNFRFHARPAPGKPEWFLPTRTPRWKGRF